MLFYNLIFMNECSSSNSNSNSDGSGDSVACTGAQQQRNPRLVSYTEPRRLSGRCPLITALSIVYIPYAIRLRISISNAIPPCERLGDTSRSTLAIVVAIVAVVRTSHTYTHTHIDYNCCCCKINNGSCAFY